ncbi:MAG: MotA/TolQ/ExbB proton channel family protein [Desulfonatronovibrionaceae bacterium]
MDFFSGSGFLHMVAEATLVVKLVMVILLSMSVVSWAVIIYKTIVLVRYRSQASSQLGMFEHARDLVHGMKLLKQSENSPLYTVGYSGIAEMQRVEKSEIGPNAKFRVAEDNLKRVLGREVDSRLKELSRALPFLATCANAAPFIGLFGTVWGIMHSFHSIGMEQSAALAAVAPGISEALVATAFGLAVAIPASVAYNSFLGQLEAIRTELNRFSGVFINRARLEMPWMGKEKR